MRNNSSAVWLAFLGGVALGAVAGILYAPDTGANTRDKLSYRLGKYYTRLQQLLGQMERGGEASSATGSPSPVQAQDYKKAEALLREVESLLDDMKGKN